MQKLAWAEDVEQQELAEEKACKNKPFAIEDEDELLMLDWRSSAPKKTKQVTVHTQENGYEWQQREIRRFASQDVKRGDFLQRERDGQSSRGGCGFDQGQSSRGGGGFNQGPSSRGGGGFNQGGGGGFNQGQSSRGGGGFTQGQSSKSGGGFIQGQSSRGGGFTQGHSSRGSGFNQAQSPRGGGFNQGKSSRGGGFDSRGGGAFNQGQSSRGGVFNQGHNPRNGGFNQGQSSRGGVFNQARGGGFQNGGFNQKNQHAKGGGAFNQARGGGAFDQTRGGGEFNQTKSGESNHGKARDGFHQQNFYYEGNGKNANIAKNAANDDNKTLELHSFLMSAAFPGVEILVITDDEVYSNYDCVLKVMTMDEFINIYHVDLNLLKKFHYIVSTVDMQHENFCEFKFVVCQKQLPIMRHLRQILTTFEKEKILVVAASTGSGKSTEIPPALARKYPLGKILVIVPTVNACNALARRVKQKNPDLDVGSAAGKVIKYTDTTQLVFATAGHVINVLFRHKGFKHFTHVVLDEAHTVSPDYEQIALLVQNFGFQGVYFMITTATFYTEISQPYEVLVKKAIVLLEVDVPMFPIEESFEEESFEREEDLRNAMVNFLIAKNKEPMEEGHFLVFCPGEEFINALYEALCSQQSILQNCRIYCAYSSQSMEENDIAFDQRKPLKGDFSRSIILATNIAETSVTIPGVVLVLNSGKQKIVTIGTNDAIKLITVDVSAFAAKQRKGRTGRTNKGYVHHMYTEEFSMRLESTYSTELKRTPLTEIILKFLSFDVCPLRVLCKSPFDHETMVGEPVLAQNDVRSNIDKLIRIGLLVDNHPTKEALAICSMNLRLPLRRCLYQLQNNNDKEFKQSLGFLTSLLAIAIAEVEATQSLTYYRRKGSDESTEQFQDFCDDQSIKLHRFRDNACCPLLMSIIVVFKYAFEMKHMSKLGFFANTKKWCFENSINYKALIDVKTCLFRMGYYQIENFNIGDKDNEFISHWFIKTTIPLFQSGYENQEMEFVERQSDKWFPADEDAHAFGSFYRLNNRGFSKDFQTKTNQILALALSEVQSGNSKVMRFIGPFVPLEPLKDHFDDESSD